MGKFKCRNCGNEFKDKDLNWKGATENSLPNAEYNKCPKCGSTKTDAIKDC